MRFEPRAPRRPSENIVPLINVVFLLLVFFILTGSLRPPPALDVELPRERADAPLTPPEAGVPSLSLATTGEMAFQGASIDAAGLERALRAHPIRALALRADANTPARIVLPLLESLEASGVEQIDLVTDLAD